MSVQITVITSKNPSRLTKEVSIKDGKLTKEAGGALVEGEAVIKKFRGLEELKSILVKLNSNQALIHGLPISTPIRIMSKTKWDEAGRPEGAIPRSIDHFKWQQNSGVMMIDYDVPDDRERLEKEELVNAIRIAVPGLKDVSMLWWPSASSNIINTKTGKYLQGLRGQRLYILVQNATDIPRAGKALIEHLWAAGYGHVQVNKAGALLERTIVDASVWQANRLDFAAGADCIPPLMQKRGQPAIIKGKIEIADTTKLIPEPQTTILNQANTERKKMLLAKVDEAKVRREQWIDQRVSEMVANDADQSVKDNAREIALRALEHDSLSGDFILHVMDKDRELEVSISDVLDKPERYNGLKTLDPIEPGYDGRRAVGKLYLIGSQPTLYSFAHGGRVYKLHQHIEHIELKKGRTHDAILETLDTLRKAPDVFDFGSALVTVENGRIHPLDQMSLMHYLGGTIQYWRWNTTGKRSYKDLSDAPEKLVKQILSLGERRGLKNLEAVVTGPTLRPDGSILSKLGYDDETGLLLECRDKIVSIPNEPNEQEVASALKTLLEPFDHFPTVRPLDRGILLASLLTAAARPAFKTSPAFGFDAPTQASGKTLLATAVGALAVGEYPAIWPHTAGRDDEEARKRLFVALRSGTRALVWDNVVGTFNSASMSTAITGASFSDRILGKSESNSVPNRSIILLTGNNLTLGGDLARRVLKCRIDAKTERPYARKFDFDPVQTVLANRQNLLAAALTIIRGYLISGAEQVDGRMASFEEWDDIIRQTVIWVDHFISPGNFEDPMNAVFEAQSMDPEQEILGELLKILFELFGSEWKSASDIFKLASDEISFDKSNSLSEILNEIKGSGRPLSSKGVGRLLANRRGRIAGGLRLEAKKDTSAGALIWRVVKTSEL